MHDALGAAGHADAELVRGQQLSSRLALSADRDDRSQPVGVVWIVFLRSKSGHSAVIHHSQHVALLVRSGQAAVSLLSLLSGLPLEVEVEAGGDAIQAGEKRASSVVSGCVGAARFHAEVNEAA